MFRRAVFTVHGWKVSDAPAPKGLVAYKWTGRPGIDWGDNPRDDVRRDLERRVRR